MVWVERIADRLPNWKARLLSLAGRTTLVRHVLSAIPVYILVAIKCSQMGNQIDRYNPKGVSMEMMEECKRWKLSCSMGDNYKASKI
jgi:hypothetical protein